MRRIIIVLLCALSITGVAIPQDDAKRIAFQDAANVFTGTSHDFLFNGALSQPAVPTLGAGASTGGSCASTNVYRIYTSYVNATGETQLSPPSTEFQPTSGSTNKIVVGRGTTTKAITDAMSSWRAWFSSSATNHTIIYACSTSGAIASVATSSSTTNCLCDTSTDAQEPVANTTANVHVMTITVGPSSMLATIGSGVTMGLNGPTGTTYLRYNPDYGSVDIFNGGAVMAAATPSSFQPGGACPSDVSTMEIGFCLNAGRWVYRDATGIRYLTGTEMAQ